MLGALGKERSPCVERDQQGFEFAEAGAKPNPYFTGGGVEGSGGVRESRGTELIFAEKNSVTTL